MAASYPSNALLDGTEIINNGGVPISTSGSILGQSQNSHGLEGVKTESHLKAESQPQVIRKDSLEDDSGEVVKWSKNDLTLEPDINVPNEVFDSEKTCEQSSSASNGNKDDELVTSSVIVDSGDDGTLSSMESKRLPPMAFTIDFGCTKTNVKKIPNISERMSNYVPKHRRNLSLTNAEELDKKRSPEGGPSSLGAKLNKSENSNRKVTESRGTSKQQTDQSQGKTGHSKDIEPTSGKTLLSRNGAKDVKTTKPLGQKSSSKKSSTSPKKPLKTQAETTQVSSKSSPEKGGDAADTHSESGTYTVDDNPEVDQARKDIDNVVSKEKSNSMKTTVGMPGWVSDWAQMASQHRDENEEGPETNALLLETEGVVTAMQERLNQSARHRGAAAEEILSDDELIHMHSSKTRPSHLPMRTSAYFNRLSPREELVMSDSGYGFRSLRSRTFGIDERTRIGRAGYESEGSPTVTKRPSLGAIRPIQVVSNSNSSQMTSSSSSATFVRNDGGRFSLRMAKTSRIMPTIQANNEVGNCSTISPRISDVPISPPKALQQRSAPSRKPPTATSSRSQSSLTAKEVELANWKRRKNYDPLKAAARGKTSASNKKPFTTDTEMDDRTTTSRSPLSSSQHSRSPIERYAYSSREDNEFYHNSSYSPSSRAMMDDQRSPVSPVPVNRSTHQLEALDTLVIATIYSLSTKIRNSARGLLEKLQSRYTNDENGALMEEMISQLRALEITAKSPTNKNPSRELSGTLKNLKKLEQVILVLDRVHSDDTDGLE